MSQYYVMLKEPSRSKYKKLDSAERAVFMTKHFATIRQKVIDWITENNLQGEITNIGDIEEDTVLPLFQVDSTKDEYVNRLRTVEGVFGILAAQVPYLID